MTKPPPYLCIYHDQCADGFCAAWLVRLALGEASVEFLPAQYGDAPPEVAGRHVLIVDFSYPAEVLVAMSKRASSIRVLDHHKTAEEACRGLPFCTFDLEKSGARLTSEYLEKSTGQHTLLYRQWLVDYTEDRDLWRWQLQESREVNAALASYRLRDAIAAAEAVLR